MRHGYRIVNWAPETETPHHGDVLKARQRRTVQTAFLTRNFRSILTGNS
jgi:hypothetical protein